LHWLTAALVVLLWCVAMVIDDFSRGPPRVAARSVHIVLGVILLVVMVARIHWRLRSGRRLPRSNTGVIGAMETCTHLLLYAGLVTVLLLGLSNAWIRGDSLFGLIKIQAPAGALHALKPSVETAHRYAAHALMVVAALHAMAALCHHFVIRDCVLGRMGANPRS
jgi:cytochrome b561